jgi:hypothetical protein
MHASWARPHLSSKGARWRDNVRLKALYASKRTYLETGASSLKVCCSRSSRPETRVVGFTTIGRAKSLLLG